MIVGLCTGRPADWWDTEDDGARLALALCRACPALQECPSGDPHPKGVVRAGNAYSDTGAVLPICPTCGYPQVGYKGGPVFDTCGRCKVSQIPMRFVGVEARKAYWRARKRAAETDGAMVS